MSFDVSKIRERFLASDKFLNEASDYGVSAVLSSPPEGKLYWHLCGIYHLTGEENKGKHNLFFEMLSRGRRSDITLSWTWEGKKPNETANPIPQDKPPNELPDLPIWWGQIISAWPTTSLFRDTITGISTMHPDEGSGNSAGHHSFYVLWDLRTKGKDGDNSSELEKVRLLLEEIETKSNEAQVLISELRRTK